MIDDQVLEALPRSTWSALTRAEILAHLPLAASPAQVSAALQRLRQKGLARCFAGNLWYRPD